MNTLRACWKLSRVAWHMASGLATISWVFPTLNPAQKQQRIQAWSLALLDHIAIDLVVLNQPPGHEPRLLVSNHISWLDVYVILATCPCRFVAKSEVRQWPLLGRLAAACGTLFIARQSPRDALRVVHCMATQLQTGDTLALFPEGTTSNGQQVLPFHANLFQAAISAQTLVQPAALRYAEVGSGEVSPAPCYIDDDTLLGSIWRTLKAPPLRATLHFGAAQEPGGHDRRSLAAQTHAAVDRLRREP